MTDKEFELLDLINDNHTLNEISNILNLSPKQLYHYFTILTNQGYSFTRKYYYDGSIKYLLNRNLEFNSNVAIITPHDLTKLDLMVISDIHLSSCKERLDLLDEIYNYCIKHNIHSILIPGDIIDGFFGHLPKKYNTSHEQIEYCVKTYPFDKNILNYLVLGNHDYSTLTFYGQDLGKVLYNRRHDMIVTGYGEGKIHIKNDFIILRHPLKIVKEHNELCSKTLIIKGHTHRFKLWNDHNNCVLYAPTLSDINNEDVLPGAVHITLDLLNGYIKKCLMRQLTYFKDKFYTTGESEIYIGNGKPFRGNKEISYEEDLPKILKK